jgi:mannose/fructose-specific phosphotransferase system component IIA
MHMKLDDIELIKREDQDGAVKEIRSVRTLSVFGRRRIVELPIPGAVGNVFQDMGRNPLTISFDGELVGPNAASILQDLTSKFEMKKPILFSSDITPISDISEVIIENFVVHLASGVNLGILYSMILKEHTSASTGGKRGPGETEPPSQEESSKKEIQQKTKEMFEDAKSKR